MAATCNNICKAASALAISITTPSLSTSSSHLLLPSLSLLPKSSRKISTSCLRLTHIVNNSGRVTVRAMSSESGLEDTVKKTIADYPVVVYSKSWCSYSSQVKQLFKKLGVQPHVIELDQLGKMLEAQYPHMFWTPCAAHCMDLILEDIHKVPVIHKSFSKAMYMNSFIYSKTSVINMLRSFTSERELIRPAKTRFATAFLTLQRIHKQKSNLRKMFTSEKWNTSPHAKSGKKVCDIVLQQSFWNNVVYALKVSGPLVKVLRLVDSEKKPAMGYIYEAMDRAKEAIAKSFNENTDKYSHIFKIIDERWDVQLHQPLHAAGYYLNPEFFYANKSIEKDEEVLGGLYTCIEKMVPQDVVDKISLQLPKYAKAEGHFGLQMAKRQRTIKSPAEWWRSYGAGVPDLQKLAIRILSLTCSSSGCERNWSVFEHVLKDHNYRTSWEI